MNRLFLSLWLVVSLASNLYADGNAGVTVVTLAKSSSRWDGAQLPAYPAEMPEITLLRITIPVGVTLPMHQHPVINAGVLLSGELTVTTRENKTLVLKAGDPIIEVVNTWHSGKNTGDVSAEIIVFYAGFPGASLSVKE